MMTGVRVRQSMIYEKNSNLRCLESIDARRWKVEMSLFFILRLCSAALESAPTLKHFQALGHVKMAYFHFGDQFSR